MEASCASLLVALSRVALLSRDGIGCGGRFESILRIFGRSDHRISQRADAADTDFHDVACSQRPNARGRAGGNDVARFKRHHLRDKANYNIKRKNHFCWVSKLFPVSIHESL